jgi:HD-GYP domain-containing protein (c-di-GMP phosphodiesterase class II)
MAEPAPADSPPRRLNPKVLAAAAAIAVALAGVVALAFYFVEDERRRDLQDWQVRLGIVADSRAQAVNDWLDGNFRPIRELAQNASLQLYMSELAFAGEDGGAAAEPILDQAALGDLFGDDVSEIAGESAAAEESAPAPAPAPAAEPGGAAQAGYLRNLLVATAEREGFKPPEPVGEIAANVEVVGVAGLGLVDAEMTPLVSTPGMPPMNRRIRDAVEIALNGEPALIDIYSGAAGDPTIGFVLPVYGIQDEGAARGIGAVIGIKVLDDSLFEALEQPGDTSETAETYLVRQNKGVVEYLSPLQDGTPPLKRTLAMDTPELAAAYAIERTGGFGVLTDYDAVTVLATSRAIAETTWTLIRKIDRNEALADTDRRLATMLGVFIALIVFVVLTLLYVWKKGASVRATKALHDAQVALERFTNLSKFMKVVTNSQPTHIVAVSEDTTYTFANEPAYRDGGFEDPAEMMGKTMSAVIGPLKAKVYADIHKDVLKNFERQNHVLTFGEEGDPNFQIVQADFVPLRGDRDFPPAVLTVINDITELTHERRRAERMLRQLIDTLVSVVDRRDPYSANHSTRVAEVAKAVAHEMGLGSEEVKTVDIAGSLMNLGKIFISADLLTKTDNLTAAERAQVANAYLVSCDLLENVSFQGPVVETIRQMGETWDGKGPLGLKGEEVLMTARVLAVSNAFVGMVSARAYRAGMPFQKTADILLQDTGTRYDRKPVTALVNILENRDGATKWAHFGDDPTADDDPDAPISPFDDTPRGSTKADIPEGRRELTDDA